jgi:hypothetical protein
VSAEDDAPTQGPLQPPLFEPGHTWSIGGQVTGRVVSLVEVTHDDHWYKVQYRDDTTDTVAESQLPPPPRTTWSPP